DHILCYMENWREKTKPTIILNFVDSRLEPVHILGSVKELTGKIHKATNPFELLCEPIKKERPKESKEELLKKIDDCPLKAYDVWRHYKGEEYRIIGLSICEKTAEVLVHYFNHKDETLHRSVLFTRPLSEWMERITLESGVVKSRYTFVRNLLDKT